MLFHLSYFLSFCYFFVSCVDRYFLFFFKQKTAYEMRISDWSSDVCSSDLALAAAHAQSRPRCLAAGRDRLRGGPDAGPHRGAAGPRGDVRAAEPAGPRGRDALRGAPAAGLDRPLRPPPARAGLRLRRKTGRAAGWERGVPTV